jgi:hypothetical protein
MAQRRTPGRLANLAGITAIANALLGGWLIAAPFLLSFERGSSAYWNDLVVGFAVLLLSAARTAAPVRFARIGRVTALLGAWLVFAPFVLNYDGTESATAATLNDVIVGLAVALLALLSLIIVFDVDAGDAGDPQSSPITGPGRQQ